MKDTLMVFTIGAIVLLLLVVLMAAAFLMVGVPIIGVVIIAAGIQAAVVGEFSAAAAAIGMAFILFALSGAVWWASDVEWEFTR